MREQNDFTTAASAAPEAAGILVSIFVPDDHPLLQLKRTLNWAAITAVMVRRWREAGKNVYGGPGRPWPVLQRFSVVCDQRLWGRFSTLSLPTSFSLRRRRSGY